MKTLSREILMITLTTALSAPAILLAAENAPPANPMYEQMLAMQARMQAMQGRMQAMQQTEGAARTSMMPAQTEDKEIAMKTLSREILMIALATALNAPATLLAAAKATPGSSMYEQTQTGMQAMMKDFGAGFPMSGGQGNIGMQGQRGMPMMPGMHSSQAR